MEELRSLPGPYQDMSVDQLRQTIRHMEQLLGLLKEKAKELQTQVSNQSITGIEICNTQRPEAPTPHNLPMTFQGTVRPCPRDRVDSYRCRHLTAKEYKRYGRQMILPEVGLAGGLEPS